MRILHGAKDLPDVYSRLPLRTTPTIFAPGALVFPAPDATSHGVATTDRRAEVSVLTAKALGLLPAETSYSSTWQFRAVLCSEGGFCLYKGMLLVNRNGQGVLLRESCIKVRWQTVFKVPQQQIRNICQSLTDAVLIIEETYCRDLISDPSMAHHVNMFSWQVGEGGVLWQAQYLVTLE